MAIFRIIGSRRKLGSLGKWEGFAPFEIEAASKAEAMTAAFAAFDYERFEHYTIAGCDELPPEPSNPFIHIFAGTRKVNVTRAGVLVFNAQWPCSELRPTRSYWFEFDSNGDLIDTDTPQHDDGAAASAIADDCRAFLMEDETPAWAAI